ncbi:MAG TPA: XRE family transcriptional regulator [Spirochaetia bacterium]|nr:XRE family transcriptional regulator [Spirochaetia bacterium]
MGPLDASVSENLRLARKAQNLSLDELSRRSGVSKSMLRQIEIGRSSPTISVLWKVANGLKVPFSSLLAKKQTGAEVADFTSQGQIRSGKKGYRLFPLVLFQPDRPFEVYYAEIDEGVEFDGEPHQGKARETVFVISGSIEVTLGDTTSVAHENQLVQFLAGSAHHYLNPGKKTARVLMSIDYAQ